MANPVAHHPAGSFGFSRKGRGQSMAAAAGSTAAKQSRALIPPITPRLILRALLGLVLFFSGIVLGVWLIIRFRRLDRGHGAPDALR